jgi:hypothetical protein
MSKATRKAAWMVLGAGSAMAAGALVQYSLDASWRKVTDDDPPASPPQRGRGWSDSLMWIAGTAMVAALAQVLAKQGAAAGWRKATGKKPPA